ncbi:MAG: hypothetical protein NW201_12000 [Gemmatimonadales bacterium]|nr:hypothetical protein [Gemmatimonadales bacterium]
MDAHLRQQFDLLLTQAVAQFVERIEHRAGGAAEAHARLRDAPEGEGIWLGRFTEAFFADQLLDNPEGAAWVAAVLARRPGAAVAAGPVGSMLQQLARDVFAALLRDRTLELLERELVHADAGSPPA